VARRKTQALYVKVFEKVSALVSQFAPSCAAADFEEASVSVAYNRGLGQSPPEAKSFPAFRCPVEVAELPHSAYFANKPSIGQLYNQTE